MQRYRILPAGTIVAPIEISDDEEVREAEPPVPKVESMDRKRKRVADRITKTEPIYVDSDDECQLVGSRLLLNEFSHLKGRERVTITDQTGPNQTEKVGRFNSGRRQHRGQYGNRLQ